MLTCDILDQPLLSRRNFRPCPGSMTVGVFDRLARGTSCVFTRQLTQILVSYVGSLVLTTSLKLHCSAESLDYETLYRLPDSCLVLLKLRSLTIGRSGKDQNAMRFQARPVCCSDWPEGGPKLAWRTEGLGGGDSAPAVAKGMLLRLKQPRWQRDRLGVSEADGQRGLGKLAGRCSHSKCASIQRRSRRNSDGPTVTTLYVIGMSGRIACLDTKDGNVVWQKSLKTDFGGTAGRCGVIGSRRWSMATK